jgi:hypothetical protein
MAGPAARLKPWQDNQILTALAFLQRCRKSRTTARSSYWLKHQCENWGAATGMARYVSNGSLIIGAVALGFPVEPSWDEHNPNGDIGVNPADIDKLIAVAEQYRRSRLPGPPPPDPEIYLRAFVIAAKDGDWDIEVLARELKWSPAMMDQMRTIAAQLG